VFPLIDTAFFIVELAFYFIQAIGKQPIATKTLNITSSFQLLIELLCISDKKAVNNTSSCLVLSSWSS
jgi:hypothetical protein